MGSTGSKQKVSPTCKGENGAPMRSCEVFCNLNQGNDVFLKNISVSRVPMQRMPALYHDLVVIEVNQIKEQDGSIRKSFGWISAQKSCQGGRGVVDVDVLEVLPQNLVTKFTARVDKRCSILVSELEALLKDPEAHYNVISNNCWKYADVVYQKLLRRMSQLPHIRPDIQSNLERQLERHPPLRLPSTFFLEHLHRLLWKTTLTEWFAKSFKITFFCPRAPAPSGALGATLY